MSWFKNLGITKKLMFSFLLLTALTIEVGVKGIHDLGAMADNGETAYTKMTKPNASLGETADALERIRVTARDLAIATTPEQATREVATINQLRTEVDQHLDEVRPTAVFPKTKEAMDELDNGWKEYQPCIDQICELGLHKREDLSAYIHSETPQAIMKKVMQGLHNSVQCKVDGAAKLNDENTEAYTSSELSRMAGELQQLVSQFKYSTQDTPEFAANEPAREHPARWAKDR